LDAPITPPALDAPATPAPARDCLSSAISNVETEARRLG
jgi:hypothetical protein